MFTAPVTLFLLRINIGIFLLCNIAIYLIFGPAGPESIVRTFGISANHFAPWQLLTSAFLHGSFLHIAMNMLALWSLGLIVESRLGSVAFLRLYLLSAVGGAALAVALQNPQTVTIGASGAISGLLAAIALLTPDMPLLFFIVPMRARTAALAFFGISALLLWTDAQSGISHAGHLGGFLAGAFYTFLRIKRQWFPPVSDVYAREIPLFYVKTDDHTGRHRVTRHYDFL